MGASLLLYTALVSVSTGGVADKSANADKVYSIGIDLAANENISVRSWVTIYGDTRRYPCRIHASLDYRDSRPRSPRTRRDSGMTASFQYSSAVCINPIAMRS